MPILTERERVGTRLAGKYQLSAILGRGGMGTVYAGTHAWTGRRVAVKLLKPSFAEDANVVRRFLREARAAAAIRHPHVVDVLDMGQEPDGTVYMVLELLEGESLGALVRRRGRVPADDLLPIALPIADALVEVHAAGLVHRDLKPDNIYVATRRGRMVPKLLDFGIAKILEDSSQSSATRTGAIVGTPHYMSPEQASGSREIGPASDVWSFGVVLYECLSGALPFDAENTTGVLVRILTSSAPPLATRAPDVPTELACVVDRAMQADRAQRFLDMRSMRDALREASRALGIAIPDTVPDDDAPSITADLGRESTGEILPIEVGSIVEGGAGQERKAVESAPTLASDHPRPRSTPGQASVAPAPSVHLPPTAARRTWIVAAVGALVVLAIGLAIGRSMGSSSEPEASRPEPAAPASIVPDASVAAAPPTAVAAPSTAVPSSGVPSTTPTDHPREVAPEEPPGGPAAGRTPPRARAAMAHAEGATGRPREAESTSEAPRVEQTAAPTVAEPTAAERPADGTAPARRPGVRDEW